MLPIEDVFGGLVGKETMKKLIFRDPYSRMTVQVVK